MAPEQPTVGGGGAATSAGILFQQQVGALVGSWLLTQSPFDQRFDLGQVTPVWMRFETEAPVDDILVSTSADGFVAIQAKTTASLSRDLSSPFGQTVSQFVRHWLECHDGNGDLRWNRPLNSKIDRLVLAVGPQAPATIRKTLPEALRLRSQPGGGELNAAQQKAFDKFEACVAQAWARTTADDYDPAFAQTLATFVSIFTFDPVGLERTAIETVLGSVVPKPADGTATLTGLEAICGELMAQRGGIDLGTMRQKLMGRGVRLRPRRDFRQDIAKLRRHSEEIAGALKRHEIIEAVDGGDPVSIERECQNAIREAALGGHLLIIGEPGAGKSGVLNALARDLRSGGNDVLQLAVDRYSVETLEGLQNELGIGHGLIETLDAWDGTEPGWLIVDALDATRGGHGEDVFRKLIERVMERDGRWKVIASIRTFDLRMGRQFRELFKGTPPLADLQEQEFQAVRHIRVPSWSQKEFAQLRDRAPKLAAALDNAPAALLKLAKVPFNTRLLSDLVKDGSVTTGFSHIASQAELLQLYWKHRVEAHRAPARECILRIVKAMVKARALRAPFTAVSSESAMLDSLESEGVLISGGNGRHIQFRHHLMFDFAAARVLLDPDDLIAGTLKFDKSDARGLMLAPALAFVLREVWDREPDRGTFWTVAASLLADGECDPVIRSATGRICAEYPSSVDDMTVLAQRIIKGDELSVQAFIHMSGAVAIWLEDYPDMPLAPWVRLVRDIAPNVAPVSGALRFLLLRLIGSVEGADDRADLGTAARALLAFAFTQKNPGNLVPSAIDLVADTYITDPAASRPLLAHIFEPERLKVFAAQDVPAICRKIEAIAAPDPEFGEQIYRETYGFEVTGQQQTLMSGSQILSLTSNARQDYRMARYNLGEFIEKFLQMHPDHAVSAIVHAVEDYVVRKYPLQPKMLDTEIQTDTHVVRLRKDWSYIWDLDPDSRYDHDADDLIRKLVHYLRSAETNAAFHIAKRLVATSSLAVFWSRLFLVASERNDALIDFILPIAMCEKFLTLRDTRKDAVDAIAQGYDRLESTKREAFESAVPEFAVPEFDFSLFERPDDARASFERHLFGAIGSARLATARARAVAEEARDIDDAQNVRPVVVHTTSRISEPYYWIDNLDRNLPANQVLMEAIERIKEFLETETDANDGSPVSLQASLDAMEALTADIDREAQKPQLIVYAEDQIARGVKRIIERKLVPDADDDAATTRFLKLLDLMATSDAPRSHHDTEANFENHPSRDFPAPRVDAAEAVLDLTQQRPDLYSRLEPVIDALLQDAHPAVRVQAVFGLVSIWTLDREGFWRRLSDRLAIEPNPGVIDRVTAKVLRKILHVDPDRMEPLALRLLDRFSGESERQARMRQTLAGLLAILWVTYERPDAHAILKAWIADAATHHSALNKILVTLRGAFTAGLNGKANTDENGRRHRAQALAHEIVAAANHGLANHFRIETPTEQQNERGRNHAQLLDAACLELYFASDAGRDSSDPGHAIEDDALADFFVEVGPILHSIGDCATPHTIYHLLKLLEYLLPIDPARAFDLMAHALQSGGQQTGYQFESIGADLLVRLVGIFLADHKELFENEERRAALIACLEIFMDAGWPAAHRLLYRLPELIQ